MSWAPAVIGPSAYWYLARGTGAVSLVLLTGSVVLGVLGSLRFAAAPRWPRFTIDALHRDISLLALALIAVHIVTSVLDGFAPINLTDAVIPFNTSYRPLWMGLGALAFDLLLALVLTSLLRRRLGYPAWRAIHWLAYASWPVAVLHGLGTGSDQKSWWMLALTVACVAAVTVAVLSRIARVPRGHSGLRTAASALAVATPIGMAVFALAGPLQRGWAGRAGTPPRLLGSAGRPVRALVPRAAQSTSRALSRPFSASVTGTVRQTPQAGGEIVELALRLSGSARGRLRVRLGGTPLGEGGGLSMTGSQVDLILAGVPTVLEGRIVSLDGQRFLARVADTSGSVLDLHADLNIDGQSGDVSGTVSGGPTGGSQ